VRAAQPVCHAYGQERTEARSGCDYTQIFGDGVTLDEEEFAEILKVMEDEQATIYKDCYAHFLGYFQRADEDGKGSLLGDTFKTVLADMEGEYGTSFMTERAVELIATAAACAQDPEENPGLTAPSGTRVYGLTCAYMWHHVWIHISRAHTRTCAHTHACAHTYTCAVIQGLHTRARTPSTPTRVRTLSTHTRYVCNVVCGHGVCVCARASARSCVYYVTYYVCALYDVRLL